MNGDTLELALALMRAPSMRTLLRQRPLPDDVGELIELAADVPGRAAAAAAQSGETPSQVLEAARFYLREVLLFADADAYRVLGVVPDAATAKIKEHHRLLQRWLHPDRRDGDWESVFATRVNAAWAELRTPARRAAYDARRGDAPAVVAAAATPRRILIRDPEPTPEPEAAPGWRNRLWLAVAAGAGLWLLLLVVRQSLSPGPEWEPSDRHGDDVAERGLVATTMEAAANEAKKERGAGGATRPAAAVSRTMAPPPAPPRAVLDSAGAPPAMRADAEVRMPPSAVPEPVQERLVAVPQDPVPVPPDPIRDRAPAIAVLAAAMEEARPEAQPEEAVAPFTPRPEVAVEAPAAAMPAETRSAPAVPAPMVELSPEQVRLVHRSGGQLIRYLGSTSVPPPPIWRSVRTLEVAAAIRERLGGGDRHFADPDWRIDADRARMVSVLQPQGEGDRRAVLRAEFAWTEGRWLLDRLQMDQWQSAAPRPGPEGLP